MPIFVLPLAHSQWKSLVTWTDLSNGHIAYEHAIKDGERVTHVHAATIQTGHDMPAGLARLTQFLCCASHNSAMEMARVLSSAYAISMTSVQCVLDQPVCSMLVYYSQA